MASNPTHELKSLQTRLSEARIDYKAASDSHQLATQALLNASSRVTTLENQIKSLMDQTKDPIVSEHAMLRYLERHRDLDLEGLRREILSDTLVGLLRFTRSGKVKHEGLVYVVKNGTIVTVENPT